MLFAICIQFTSQFWSGSDCRKVVFFSQLKHCCTTVHQAGDVDVDMVADAALMLWHRAKTILHRHQSPVLSFTKCLARIDHVGKVLYSTVCSFISLCLCVVISGLQLLFSCELI